MQSKRCCRAWMRESGWTDCHGTFTYENYWILLILNCYGKFWNNVKMKMGKTEKLNMEMLFQIKLALNLSLKRCVKMWAMLYICYNIPFLRIQYLLSRCFPGTLVPLKHGYWLSYQNQNTIILESASNLIASRVFIYMCNWL